MTLVWKQPTLEEAQALESEGPIFSTLEDGVPTLSVDSQPAPTHPQPLWVLTPVKGDATPS